MLIRLKADRVGDRLAWRAGDEIDIPGPEAARLIAAGKAVPVELETMTKQPAENAALRTTKPNRRNRNA